MRKLQLLLGLVLAVAAFLGVIILNRLTQPPTYEVVVAIKDVPPFTALKQDEVAVDTQSMSPAIADRYVQADELSALLSSGAVVVENLRPGQPLLRAQIASGADAEKVSRLAVAINDPDLVILAVPVKPDNLPAVVPGDAVALFYANGNVQAQQIVTAAIEGPTPTPDPTIFNVIPGKTGDGVPEKDHAGVPIVAGYAVSETHIITTELQLPVAKWIASGVVYRLNREVRENPNYGAPGQDTEPRYIEGDIQSIDVVVAREAAEWITFALSNGKVQIGLLPAVVREQVEKKTLPATLGVTWSDFEDKFFEDRKQGSGIGDQGSGNQGASDRDAGSSAPFPRP